MRALRLHSEEKGLDFESAVGDFPEDCRFRNLSPRTIEWYRYSLGPFVRFLADRGSTAVDAVTEAVLRAFLVERASQVGPRRVNHYRGTLLRLFAWLEDQARIDHNPAQEVPKLREPQKLVPTFTADELDRLLAQPDPRGFLGLRDRVLMLLLLDTGMRLSEALGLRLDDLDFETATMRVLGKGRKDRIVGLSADLSQQLRRYLQRRQAALADIGRPTCPWLLPNHNGGKAGPKTFQTPLRRYASLAGITRVRVSPHTFRHTFAVWFVRHGGSPFHLQKILGHSSLDMSRRYCELNSPSG